MSIKFKFASDPINNIMPLQNSKILVLCKEKNNDFDARKGNLSNRLNCISSGVHQIAQIPSSGELLLLMISLQHILRISSRGLITTYISTKRDYECYECVGSAGEQAYACVVHATKRQYRWFRELSLLDEFGRILMSFNLDFSVALTMYYTHEKRTFVCGGKNKFIIMDEKDQIVKLVEGTGNKIEMTNDYRGCVGTNPCSVQRTKQ